MKQLFTIDDILNYTDEMYNSKYQIFDSLMYINLLNEVFISKYDHAFLLYSFSDNWSLFLFSELTQFKHRGIVIPEHLLQYNIGICSQQALAFIAVVEKKGYRARPFRLNKHFCSEIFVNGKWRFIDTDLKLHHPSTLSMPSGEELKLNETLRNTYYLSNIQYDDREKANSFFDWVEPAPVGKFAAPNLLLLHKFTFFISNYLWLFCWLIVVYIYRDNFQKKKKENISATPIITI